MENSVVDNASKFEWLKKKSQFILIKAKNIMKINQAFVSALKCCGACSLYVL